MTKSAAVFRHMLDNTAGTIGAVLKERGIHTHFYDTFDELPNDFDPLAPDLLVVMGGGCGVYQEALYPFITWEKSVLRKRLKADRPTLGICLGAQLMAAALGEKVYKGVAGSEIGWHSLRLTAAGERSAVRHFDPARTQVMQWHGDTFDLPAGAVLLASSAVYPNQIFQWGKNSLGLQCHIEVNRRIVQSWLVSGGYDAHAGTLDVPALRAETGRWADKMQAACRDFLAEWLEQIGL